MTRYFKLKQVILSTCFLILFLYEAKESKVFTAVALINLEYFDKIQITPLNDKIQKILSVDLS
jgi:hypothetical protein